MANFFPAHFKIILDFSRHSYGASLSPPPPQQSHTDTRAVSATQVEVTKEVRVRRHFSSPHRAGWDEVSTAAQHRREWLWPGGERGTELSQKLPTLRDGPCSPPLRVLVHKGPQAGLGVKGCKGQHLASPSLLACDTIPRSLWGFTLAELGVPYREGLLGSQEAHCGGFPFLESRRKQGVLRVTILQNRKMPTLEKCGNVVLRGTGSHREGEGRPGRGGEGGFGSHPSKGLSSPGLPWSKGMTKLLIIPRLHFCLLVLSEKELTCHSGTPDVSTEASSLWSGRDQQQQWRASGREVATVSTSLPLGALPKRSLGENPLFLEGHAWSPLVISNQVRLRAPSSRQTRP